jgi:tripartite ATP-independent transporter DctM subunit
VVGLFVLVGFIALIILRVPVAITMLTASVVTIALFTPIPLVVVPQYIIIGMSKFEILAVPFFILAAEIMNTGGMTARIFRFALACVGWMRGGLAQVNIVASVVFAGLSGTAMGDAAGLGRIEIRAMQQAGYDTGFAAAVTLASCLVGPLIPPSVVLIVYAITAEVSVASLLLAGVLPGLTLAAVLMAFVFWIARSGRYECPVVPFAGVKSLGLAFLEGLPALLAPALIVGGITAGLLTVTEAGVAACFYSVAVSALVYRELSWRGFLEAIRRATLSTSMIMFLIGTATVMSWIITREQIGGQAAAWLLGFSDNVYVQLFLLNVFLLVVGALIEGLPALLVLIPVLTPVAAHIGVDPIHFGVILIFNLLIGAVTPPMGVGLFVMSNITGLEVEKVLKAMWPFFVPLLIALALITYVPAISLFIPSLFEG